MRRTASFVVPETGGRTFVAKRCVLCLLVVLVVVVIKGRFFRTELDAVGDCELDGRNGFLAPKTRMSVEVSVVVVVVALEVVVCVVV
mmetsp:Transcript_36528/g.60814  ORF Transcript_36528/g.60814 Transcript_36528/m.60814 type:complete len:87 (-) Transcript_36528:325-585(-)